MDTRLKNKHRLGIFLAWLLVIAAAAGMVSSYPYIWERAASWKIQRETYETEAMNQSRVENLAVLTQNGGYAMWMEEVQNNSGKKLRPSQVFVPELEGLLEKGRQNEAAYLDADSAETEDMQEGNVPGTEYLEEVRRCVDEIGADWNDALQTLGGADNVRTTDEAGKVLSKGNSSSGTEDSVWIKVKFDNMGRASFDGARGNQEAVALLETYQYSFSEIYGGQDPLAAQFGADYVYDGISFSGPVNRTYEFEVDKEMILDTPEENGAQLDFYDLGNSGVYLIIWTGLALILVAAAWLLPLLPVVDLGTGTISKAPLALVGAVLFGDAFVVLYGGALAAVTISGELGDILNMILGLGASSEIAGFINGLYWAATFGVVFWAALCLRSVFTLGPVRYVKERTVTGWCCRWLVRFCCFVKKCCTRFLESIIQTDWQEHSNKIILKIVIANFAILTAICCLWFFGVFALTVYSLVLFVILKKYWEKAYQKYQVLLSAINEMADGNLDVTIEQDLGVFAPFYNQLLRIQDGFKKAVQEEVKSQRMKTELVTNVSHDLKTPLTAIITYVNLLKKEDITENERKHYIQVLEGKSMRLKALIEDLFEVSKANSGVTPVNLVEVDIVSLLKQVRLELSDRIEESGVDFRWHLPEEKVNLMLDSQKTYRVFENLLVNIIKYALPGTRAYVDMQVEQGNSGHQKVVITMKNISATELKVSPNELAERFVRGDDSRNTEGSGLGLAIAKSFVELQGGKMDIEVEADLFKVTIQW